MLTPMNSTLRSRKARATEVRPGCSARQGPHQEAQKLTTRTCPRAEVDDQRPPSPSRVPWKVACRWRTSLWSAVAAGPWRRGRRAALTSCRSYTTTTRRRHGHRLRAAVHGARKDPRMSRLLLYAPALACPLLMVACMVAMRRMGGSGGQAQRPPADLAARITALERELADLRAQQAAAQPAEPGGEAGGSPTPGRVS